MTKGSYLADLVTVIGTQDLVSEKLIDNFKENCLTTFLKLFFNAFLV